MGEGRKKGIEALGTWGKGKGPLDIDLTAQSDLFDDDEAAEKAKNDAFRLLGRRMYTRKEIREKLVKREHDEATIEKTLATLGRLGFVDDRKFAEAFIRDRNLLRPSGPALIRRDLRRRGVDAELIESVVEAAFADADQAQTAFDLLCSRQSRYLGLDKFKALQRMCGFLGRRGFPPGVAREASERAWAAFEDGDT